VLSVYTNSENAIADSDLPQPHELLKRVRKNCVL
jgi:hypothetical protein